MNGEVFVADAWASICVLLLLVAVRFVFQSISTYQINLETSLSQSARRECRHCSTKRMASDNDSILREKFLGCTDRSDDWITGFSPGFPKPLCCFTVFTPVYVYKRDFKVHFPVETGFATTEGHYGGIMCVVEGHKARHIRIRSTVVVSI